MRILYSLVYKENRNSALKQDSCFSCSRYFGKVLCLFSLASDPPPWWKTRNLLCRQEFDHIQKVWVFVSGPHRLDNLYLTQVWHNGYRQRSFESSSLCWEGLGLIFKQLITFYFHIDMLLQLCLLLQSLLWHLGGAGEADNDDADVIQTALQRPTELSGNQVATKQTWAEGVLARLHYQVVQNFTPNRVLFLYCASCIFNIYVIFMHLPMLNTFKKDLLKG